MLDGFDEISSQLQEKAIHLMKAITFNKSAQLFVTTRPHMIDQLQFQLSQLAYSLENFTEKDQIDYLSEYWETNLKELEDKSVIIRKFSEYFIQRVSHTLKDKEKSFIGIPLQCRLMAEYFQSDLLDIIKENRNESEIQKLLDGQKFDLATMYKRLMETKRRVFLQEKITVSAPNQIMAYAIDGFMKKTGVGNSQLGCTKIRDSREILEILKDSMRGEIGRFWPGRTRVYEDSGELPTPGGWQ
ncbi:hypothetical protein DAPPUDRAFT_232736 [Daphnia pulex]|uniref:NACHT domain-containing protein n=1 Tax=Daphnia pulex TaxID=6669 RepID=E9FRI6_DAPPU|nr:hypothetical protein DAPPUDRAFT_232736 [Daphnia pulex]|eukprot:EFX90192.1 hypothetical protein DAPPUDRAFT_232736 [Daphnia pulex]